MNAHVIKSACFYGCVGFICVASVVATFEDAPSTEVQNRALGGGDSQERIASLAQADSSEGKEASRASYDAPASAPEVDMEPTSIMHRPEALIRGGLQAEEEQVAEKFQIVSSQSPICDVDTDCSLSDYKTTVARRPAACIAPCPLSDQSSDSDDPTIVVKSVAIASSKTDLGGFGVVEAGTPVIVERQVNLY